MKAKNNLPPAPPSRAGFAQPARCGGAERGSENSRLRPPERGDGRSLLSQLHAAPGSGSPNGPRSLPSGRGTSFGARPFARRSSIAQRGGILLGLFLGLVVGMLIAFGVVWYLNKSPLPFLDKSSREKPEAKADDAQLPLPLPGKPGDKPAEKPRFEFYKILPGGQEATPQAAPQPQAGQPQAPAQTAQPAAAGETYYLQAGAFQKSADADNLKARLAMMGMEASLQEIQVPEKGVMNRVRVGPFRNSEDMNRARNQLTQNGIQVTVVKIKNGADVTQ